MTVYKPLATESQKKKLNGLNEHFDENSHPKEEG